jgi:hypothetical protein
LCSELVWVIDQIYAISDAHAVGIILMGPMVYDNVHIGGGAVFGVEPDFIMGEKQDNVSANSGTFFSLCQPMAGTQSGLKTGLCMSLVYFVVVSLVT